MVDSMNKFNLPTWFTFSRFLAAILIPIVYLVFERPIADYIAFAVFTIGGITDYVDGRLARIMKIESKIGAALDSVADKTLVFISLAILLAYIEMREWLLLPVVIIFVRELLIAGIREYFGRSSGLNVTLVAKVKSTSQMISIGILFLSGIEGKFSFEFAVIGVSLLWISAILTLISGIDYSLAAIRDMEKKNATD